MDEDDAAQPRSQKLLHLTRSDLVQIPEHKALELLRQYDPLVRGFVRRFPRGLLGVRFDRDDLYSLAQVMLLQAWILYDPLRVDPSGTRGSFRGWATFLFRQALTKVSKDLYNNPEVLFGTMSRDMEAETQHDMKKVGGFIVGSVVGWVSLHLTEEFDPEDAVDNRLEVALFERALEAIRPRDRFILQGLREGRSTEAIGRDLGISRQRVDQLVRGAMDAIKREIAELQGEEDDFVETPEDTAEPEPEELRSLSRRPSATLLAS
jgi:RNA polymerase sigma factor (sigma-70 family)